jgi:hypothetical protein
VKPWHYQIVMRIQRPRDGDIFTEDDICGALRVI